MRGVSPRLISGSGQAAGSDHSGDQRTRGNHHHDVVEFAGRSRALRRWWGGRVDAASYRGRTSAAVEGPVHIAPGRRRRHVAEGVRGFVVAGRYGVKPGAVRLPGAKAVL